MKKFFLEKFAGFILPVLMIFIGIQTGYSAVKLADMTIEPNGNFHYTEGFKVLNPGKLLIVGKIKIKPGGFTPYANYKIDLVKGSTVLKTTELNAFLAFKTFTLTYNLVNCDQSGLFKIRIKRLSGANRQGEVQFNPLTLPGKLTKTSTMPQFSVKQGTTVIKIIPASLVPKKPGRWVITANWKSACHLKQAGCDLLFKLKRNGQVVASSKGFTEKPAVGKKMTLIYPIKKYQFGTNWHLEVVGNPEGDAIDVQPKLNFTSGCKF